MKFSLKKKLTVLSSICSVPIATSFTTSCGQTLSEIDNRISTSPDTFTYFLQNNLSTIITYESQSANDFYVLSDLFSTIVTYDKFNRVQGLTAIRQANADDNAVNYKDVKASTDEKTNSKSKYVGLHNKDFSFWKYKFRENVYWGSADGKPDQQSVANDFVNTCKAVFYTPYSSPVSSLIEGFIPNANQIGVYFDKNGGEAYVYEYLTPQDNGVRYYVANKEKLTDEEISAKKLKTDYAIIPPFNKSDDWTKNRIWNALGVWTGNEQHDITLGKSNTKTESNKDNETKYKNDDEYKYNLSIGLTSGYNYFESMLSYSAFAPLSDKDITVNVDTPISTEEFKKLNFSGGYVLNNFTVSSLISLKKNPNFVFADKVKVKNVNWIIAPVMTSTSDQQYFESGIISQYLIQSSNANAWNKYIGDNYDDPNSSAITETYNSLSTSSWGLYYNYAFNSSAAISQEGKSVNDVAANTTMISDLARSYIGLNLDRSSYAKGYCSLLDDSQGRDKSKPASFTNNTVTLNGLVSDEKSNDYTSYVEREYQNINSGSSYSSTGKNNGASDTDAIDHKTDASYGADAFYKNEKLLSNKHIKDMDGKPVTTMDGLQKALINYINDCKKNVDGFKTAKVKGQEKVQLVWVAMTNIRTYRYLNSMVQEFNQIKDNPLEIIIDGTADNDIYKHALENCGTTFESWGWSPDFSDPSSFLKTYCLGGDMAAYCGLQNIYEKASDPTSVANSLAKISLKGDTLDNYIYKSDDKDYLTGDNETVDKISSDKCLKLSDTYSYLRKSKSYNRFVSENVMFSNSVRKANDGSIKDFNYTVGSSLTNTKYNQQAVTESNSIYQDFMWLPLFRYSQFTPSLSYRTPYNSSSVLFGTAYSTHWMDEMNKNLIKHSEFMIIKNDYIEKDKAAQFDYGAFRVIEDWK